IYSSDLRRCTKTAEIIRQGLGSRGKGLEICTDKKIREINFGQWEGKLTSRLPQCGEAIKVPGGEAYKDFQKRIQSFLKDLLKKKNKTIVVVTHAGVCREVLFLLKIVPRNILVRQDLGALNILTIQDNQQIIEGINISV